VFVLAETQCCGVGTETSSIPQHNVLKYLTVYFNIMLYNT